MLSRRGLIGSLIAFGAAPAIVRASSLMPVKVYAAIEPLPYTIAPYLTLDEYAVKYMAPRLFWITSKKEIIHLSQEESNKYLDSWSG